MESNLLDFNEEKFFEDTKSIVYNNPTSRSSSVKNQKEPTFLNSSVKTKASNSLTFLPKILIVKLTIFFSPFLCLCHLWVDYRNATILQRISI